MVGAVRPLDQSSLRWSTTYAARVMTRDITQPISRTLQEVHTAVTAVRHRDEYMHRHAHAADGEIRSCDLMMQDQRGLSADAGGETGRQRERRCRSPTATGRASTQSASASPGSEAVHTGLRSRPTGDARSTSCCATRARPAHADGARAVLSDRGATVMGLLDALDAYYQRPSSAVACRTPIGPIRRWPPSASVGRCASWTSPSRVSGRPYSCRGHPASRTLTLRGLRGAPSRARRGPARKRCGGSGARRSSQW